jgi:hypothetical protein
VPSWKPGDRPPPASRPYALLPGLFTQNPWGVSQSALGGQPASPPKPLSLTLLPPCPSSRLSCYPMPFLQRYGAADLLDAALQLYRWMGHALMAAFGISSCRGELLPCPIAALDADALLRVPPFHPLLPGSVAEQLLCAPLPPNRSILARRSMAELAGMSGWRMGASLALGVGVQASFIRVSVCVRLAAYVSSVPRHAPDRHHTDGKRVLCEPGR